MIPALDLKTWWLLNLLKYCHFMEDTEGYRMDLQYLRDREGREVDFVVIKEKRASFCGGVQNVRCTILSKSR